MDQPGGNNKQPDKTSDLADRIVEKADAGEDVSPFHEEINSLSQDESLDLAKNLSKSALTNTEIGDGNFLNIDAHVDKDTGKLVDIDLVRRDFNGDEVSVTRTDIYTPEEGGEEFDKLQETEAAVAPYKQLFYLMNAHDHYSSSSRLELPGDLGDSNSPSNHEQVRALMEKNLADHPNKEALLKAFDKPFGESAIDQGFEPVDSLDSTLAMHTSHDNIPPEMKKQIETLVEAVRQLRKYENEDRIEYGKF